MNKTKRNPLKFLTHAHVILLAFFLTLLVMVIPYGIVEKNVHQITWFIIIGLIFVGLFITNVVFILQKKKSKKMIFSFFVPLIGLIPIYNSIVRLNSFFQPEDSLYIKMPFLGSLFLFSSILYVISVLALYLYPLFNLKNESVYVLEEVKEESKLRTNVFKEFATTERPLYIYVISLFIIAILFFSSVLFTENFTVPLGGDFTQQQIYFYVNGYDDWRHFFRTGEFPLWDSNTFLGANNIGSNSFYYALNPFFLPILLFPRSLIPQGITILMITKFVLAALTMRYYLKYRGVKEFTARIFSLMYAFCGWNVYYLWFNHFMEVAVMFPLVFVGIEKIFKEKEPYFLIFALAFMGLSNYFFLITTCMVGVLYAGFRFFQLWSTFENAQTRLKVIGLGIVGFAFGIFGAGLALFPGFAVAKNSDRVTNATYLEKIKLLFDAKNWKEGFEYITRWEMQNKNYDYKKYYPIISFLFPTVSDRSVTLLNKSAYDNTISSLFTYTPITLLLIPTLIHSAKKKKAGPFVALGFFIFAIFTPFFYNLFHGFTKEYGRWQLFPVFCLISYVARNYDQRDEFKRWYFDVSFLVILLLMAFTFKWAFDYQNKNTFIDLQEREYVAYYQFGMLFVVYLIYRYSYKKQENKSFIVMIATIEAIVMGALVMNFHGTISYEYHVYGGQQNFKEDEKVIRNIRALDGSYYRLYSTSARKGTDNLPMALDYNGVTTFHSLYNFELMDFNYWSKINYNYLGWSLGVHEKRPLLDQFLDIKYYVMRPNDVNPMYYGEKINVVNANVPLTHSFNSSVSTEQRLVYSSDSMFTTGFGVDEIVSYQRLQNDELIDIFRNKGKYGVVKADETYLTSGILSYEDFNYVATNHPDLLTFDYNYRPLVANELTYESNNVNKKFEKTTYYCDKPFPLTSFDLNNEAISGCAVSSLASSKKYSATVYKRSNNEPFVETKGTIILEYPLTAKVDIYVIGEDGEIITYDTHMNPQGSQSYKTLRALHVTKPAYGIVVINRQPELVFRSSSIYTYEQDELDYFINKTKENPLENVKWTKNKLSFETNYDKEKFVVTTIPYDKGWHVGYTIGDSRIGGPLKVFKTHGGFVGFVAPKGNIKYTMSFVPEGLASGILATFGAIYVGIIGLVLRNNKKKKQDNEINQD